MALSTFALLYNHHHHPAPELFSSSQTETLYPLNKKSPSPYLSSPGQHHSTFCLYRLYYCRYFIISGIIQYLCFCDWFISLSITPSRFIHVVVCVRSSFFLGRLGGSVSQAYNSWFRLKSWSHGLWVWAPHWALYWQCGACLGFSLSFFLCPSPACTASVSLQINKLKIVI